MSKFTAVLRQLKKPGTTFRSQLLRFVLITVIGFQIVFSVVSINLIHKTLFSEIVSSHADSMTLIRHQLELVRKNSSTILELFRNDENLLENLSEVHSTNHRTQEMNAYITSSKIRHSAIVDQLKLPFYITIISDGGFEYTSQSGKDYYDFNQITHSKWFQVLKKRKGTSPVFMTNVRDTDFLGNERNVTITAGNLASKSGRYIGTVLVCVEEDTYFNTYREYISPDETVYAIDENHKLFCIKDPTGNASRSPDGAITRFTASKDQYTIFSRNNHRTLAFQTRAPYIGWTIVKEVPVDSVYDSLWGLIDKILLLCFAATFIILILVFRISSRLSSPLQELNGAINALQPGDYSKINTENAHYKEILELGESFNEMQSRLCEAAQRNEEDQKAFRKTELSFLRAQINPHFLYNTLFSIKCTIETGSADKAARMLGLLIGNLQNSLAEDDEKYTLLEEFSNISKYVQLQQLRYGKNLLCRFDLPEDLENCILLRNLLQPVVENAIFHGIEPNDGRGEIFVSAQRDDSGGSLLVKVRNTGVPIPPEKLPHILEPSKGPSNHHIGLRNIHSRIQLYYGASYGVSIYSEEDGTAVVLKLPMQEN